MSSLEFAYFKGLGWVSLRWSQVYVKTRGKIDYIAIFPGGSSNANSRLNLTLPLDLILTESLGPTLSLNLGLNLILILTLTLNLA
jgi:hypothetical protein